MTPHATTPTIAEETHPIFERATGVLSHAGNCVKLTRTEQILFDRLIKSPGQILHRELLHHTLYGGRVDGGPEIKIIDVLICKVRRKLAEIGCSDLIKTAWGRGFCIAGGSATIALGLTRSEWQSLETVVALANQRNVLAAETIRSAMRRADP